MKKGSRKLSSIIFTLLMVIIFATSIVDTTAYARGGSTSRRTSTPKSTTKSTPKSGAKSGTFSKPSSSSSSKSTTGSSTTRRSGSSVFGGSSWHLPTLIFLPSFGGYHDGYGYYHNGYRGPSFLGTVFDLIVIVSIIWFIVWLIKRRRRR